MVQRETMRRRRPLAGTSGAGAMLLSGCADFGSEEESGDEEMDDEDDDDG